MKKVIISFLMVFMLAVTVFAAGPGFGQNNGPTEASGPTEAIESQKMVNEMLQEKSQVKGLTNATIRVGSQERIRQLEQVMEKIQTKTKERLNILENLEVVDDNGAVIASGVVDGKFLGLFKVKKNVRYNIDEEGNVKYMKEWFDGFFKFEVIEE